MKSTLLICSALLLGNLSMAQPATLPGQMAPMPATNVMHPEYIQFKEKVHDFGNIKQNVPVTHVFEFKNVGEKEIELVGVNASCGCTTPNWKGGKYKPQETAKITTTFNAQSEGFFSKVVTVTTSEGVETLTIRGTVLNPAAYAEYEVKKHIEDSIQAVALKKNAKKLKKAAKKKAKQQKKEEKKKAKEKLNSEATENKK